MSKVNKHINETLWSDMEDRSIGDQVRREDDIDLFDGQKMVEYIIKHYRINDNLEQPDYHKDSDTLEVPVLKWKKSEYTYHIDMVYYDYEYNIIYVSNLMFQDVYQKIKSNPSFDTEIYDKDYLSISPKKGDVNNRFLLEVIDFILNITEPTKYPIPDDVPMHIIDNKKKVYESIWSDMEDRSIGDDKRVEDIVVLEDKYADKFESCVKRFVEDIVYYEKYKNDFNDFKEYIINDTKGFGEAWVGNTTVPLSNVLLPYVEDNWDKYDNIKKQINDRVLEEERNISKIGFKKEPGKSIKDTICDWWDTLDDETKYDLMSDAPVMSREEEEFYETHLDDDIFTGEDLEADELFDRSNWDELVKIYVNYMKKSTLKECDGVPGGLTPADVGGMGAAYFPGPNGEPGSGDLPSPTGHVYHQVAPFGIFIKELKKKKKKKKFRKEDEPCSHSPNAKVYDYVDDYREYVDRTYNQMDRKR